MDYSSTLRIWRKKNMASREVIQKLTRQIFGTLPNKNISTGHQLLKKRYTAILDARYYIDSIEPAARMVCLS
jgi:hypothetical protein